jgi:hypothetical protein
MEAAPEVEQMDYQGLSFGFCSQQCFERFAENPGLYIGEAGAPAPKQRGECRVKRRVMKLESRLSEQERQKLIPLLESMMGVRQVHIDDETLCIVYDLMEATCEQIETALEQCGTKLGSDWGARLKQSFIHFLEETELDTLESSQSGHGHHHH